MTAEGNPFDIGEWDFGAAGIVAADLPPRGWLLGNWFCRQFLSALFGDGAVGKTATRIACALALATGRYDIIEEHVFQRARVLFLCFEDGETELKRRICAAMLHHNITDADIEGYLFVRAITNSELKLATAVEYGKIARGPLADALVTSVTRRQIDAVFLDPLVKTHGVNENDNNAMDLVTEIIVDLAVKHNLAADTPHHIAKGSGGPGNADSGRGASAVKDGGRLIYTQTPMSDWEAEVYGISPDERLQYVRVDQGKVNLIRRTLKTKWLKLVGVKLGNRTNLYPNGDEVQTVEAWEPPDIFKELTLHVIGQILDKIAEGPEPGRQYSAAPQANVRGAWQVIVQYCPQLSPVQAKHVIKTWIANGVLIEGFYDDPKESRPQKGVSIGKRPGPAGQGGDTWEL
jgi:hypothetical protein